MEDHTHNTKRSWNGFWNGLCTWMKLHLGNWQLRTETLHLMLFPFCMTAQQEKHMKKKASYGIIWELGSSAWSWTLSPGRGTRETETEKADLHLQIQLLFLTDKKMKNKMKKIMSVGYSSEQDTKENIAIWRTKWHGSLRNFHYARLAPIPSD